MQYHNRVWYPFVASPRVQKQLEDPNIVHHLSIDEELERTSAQKSMLVALGFIGGSAILVIAVLGFTNQLSQEMMLGVFVAVVIITLPILLVWGRHRETLAHIRATASLITDDPLILKSGPDFLLHVLGEVIPNWQERINFLVDHKKEVDGFVRDRNVLRNVQILNDEESTAEEHTAARTELISQAYELLSPFFEQDM